MSYSKHSQNNKSMLALMNKQPLVLEKNVKTDSVEGTEKKKDEIKYPAFNLSQFGKDLNDQELNDGLLAIRKPDRNGQPAKVVIPLKGISLPFMKGTWRCSLPDQRAAADETMYKRLKVAGLSKYSDPTEKMFRSNGTKRGLLTRMSAQLVTQTYSKLSTSRDIINFMYTHMPMRKVESWPTTLEPDHVAFENLNSKANAGLPYNFISDKGVLPTLSGETLLKLEYRSKSKDDIVPLNNEPMPIVSHALYWARKLWKIIDDASDLTAAIQSINSFYVQYPELRTFMLKRKDEKMDRDEFLSKVRPYGIQPLAPRFLTMWAISFIEQNIKNFQEDFNSISAYHYSPYYGGSNSIIEYFEHHYKENHRFSGLSYGDDQQWMIKCEDGSVIFLTPDVKAMDMNTQSDTVTRVGKWVKSVCPDIPDMNFRCLIVALTQVFNHAMHIGGSFIVNKTESEFSGVPGTTIWNILNSCAIQAVVSEVINEEKEKINSRNIFKVLAKAFARVKTVLGYTFKGYEGLSVIAANKTSDELWEMFKDQVYSCDIKQLRTLGLPLPFLSMKIVIMDGVPVSVPFDMYKLGASLVLPGNCADKKKIPFEKERLVGVAFSGGWVDPEFYEFLRETFDDLSKIVPNDNPLSFSELNSSLEMDVTETIQALGLKTFPPRQLLIDMNSLTKTEFAQKYSANPSLLSDYGQKEEKAITSKISSSKDEIIAITSDYTDMMKELQEFTFEANVTPVPVQPHKAGNANANDLEEEKEKKVRQQRRWDLQKLRRFIASVRSEDFRSAAEELAAQYEDQDDLNIFEAFERDFDDDLENQLEDDEWEAYNLARDEAFNSSTWDGYEEFEAVGDVTIQDHADFDEDDFGYIPLGDGQDDFASNERSGTETTIVDRRGNVVGNIDSY